MTRLKPHHFRPRFAFALLLLSAISVANTDSIEVIPLKHRPADLLIPTLTSISKGSVDITAANNQLILRGDAAELAQLRALIDELDTPLAQYKIYVRQNKGHTDNQRHSSTSYRSKSESGSIKIGKTTLDGRPLKDGGAKVVLGDSNQRVTSTVKTYSSNSHRNTEQSVRAIEGYSARIETGKEIPFLRYDHDYNHGHVSRDYKPVLTGFYVTPWQSGNDSVTLEISAQKQRLEPNNHQRLDQRNHGQIDTANYSSTVNAQLGEWINLGASLERGNQKDRSIGNRYSIQSGDNYSLELKIERVGH
tara:strand:+ start:715 stop:1629 length:915 start_codon:yes stop_codon:yes gene_type:complete